MSKHINSSNWFQSVALLPGFLGTVLLLPTSTLVNGPLSVQQFSGIFLVPAAIGVLRLFLSIGKKSNSFIEALWLLFGGLLIGASAGLGLLSLEVLYHWQLNPSNGHLEPIFGALGLAAASTEAARRFSISEKEDEVEG